MNNIIVDTISQKYSDIVLNEKTGKVEIKKGLAMLEPDYDEIKATIESAVSGATVSKKAVKEAVQVWCRDHKYTPESKSNLADWATGLEMNSKGGVAESTKNIEYYLLNCPRYRDKIKFNEYTQRIELDGVTIEDPDVAVMTMDIEENLHFYSKNKVENVIQSFERNKLMSYHPIKNYLTSVVWDGVKRIDTMLIDWMGAEDTPLNREFSRKWLIGAVKRIFEPGCKFDSMLFLQGPQGIGKSTFCERLAAGFGYTENPPIDQPKEYVPLITSNWIIGMDERGALGKKDQNLVKTFLTKTSDQVRLSYERRDKSFPRSCVFIGSTNDEKFLNDYSGMTERRYWVVNCGVGDKYKVYNKFNKQIVDQLWAETYYTYMQNPEIDLIVDPSLQKDFENAQKQFKTYDEDEAYMLLKDRLERGWVVDEFSNEKEFFDYWNEPSLNSGSKTIMIVPVRYIKLFLSNNLKIQRSPAQLKLFMDDLGFVKKNSGYGGTGKVELCYVRYKPGGEKISENPIF